MPVEGNIIIKNARVNNLKSAALQKAFPPMPGSSWAAW